MNFCFCILADDDKKRFSNLRSRYTRDKQKLKKKRTSGGGAEDVEEAKKDTSDLYPYLSWLDRFVLSRRRTKGNVISVSEDSELGGSSECDERSEVDIDSSSSSTENLSKVTGKVKWDKRKPERKTADEVEVELLKCMTQVVQRPAETPKDADALFGSFVASQLKGMTAEQNAIAKFQINQLCFQIKMSGMGMPPSVYHTGQVPSGQTFQPTRMSTPHVAPDQVYQPYDNESGTSPLPFQSF